jgi:hypothetical protein
LQPAKVRHAAVPACLNTRAPGCWSSVTVTEPLLLCSCCSPAAAGANGNTAAAVSSVGLELLPYVDNRLLGTFWLFMLCNAAAQAQSVLPLQVPHICRPWLSQDRSC